MSQRKLKWLKRIGFTLVLLGLLWAISGRVFMAFSWRDADFDSTVEEEIKHDLAVGNTGLQPSKYPCVTHIEYVDLKLHFNGTMPEGDGGNIVMSVYLDRQLYLGVPTRSIEVQNFPVCRDSLDPMTIEDNPSMRLRVDFTDLEKRRWFGYGGEQAFPILFWRDVEIDLLPIPKELSPSGSFTQVIVRPVDPDAPYPNFLTRP